MIADIIDDIADAMQSGSTTIFHNTCNPFEKGKIYMIIEKCTKKLVYIGCTIQELVFRWRGHKAFFRRFPDSQYSLHILSAGGPDCFDIVLLQSYPCQNREQLMSKETEYISHLNPPCNIRQRRDIQSTVNPNRSEFPCPNCGRVFFSNRNLKNHLNRKYPCDVGKFQCEKCSHRFNSSCNLSTHRKICTGRLLTFAEKEDQHEATKIALAEAISRYPTIRNAHHSFSDSPVQPSKTFSSDEGIKKQDQGYCPKSNPEKREMADIDDKHFDLELKKIELDRQEIMLEFERKKLALEWKRRESKKEDTVTAS